MAATQRRRGIAYEVLHSTHSSASVGIARCALKVLTNCTCCDKGDFWAWEDWNIMKQQPIRPVIVKIMIVKIRQMLLYSHLTSMQACLAQTLVTQEQWIFTFHNTCASKCNYSNACRKQMPSRHEYVLMSFTHKFWRTVKEPQRIPTFKAAFYIF